MCCFQIFSSEAKKSLDLSHKRQVTRSLLINSTVFVVSTLGFRRLRSCKIAYHFSRLFFHNFFADKTT